MLGYYLTRMDKLLLEKMLSLVYMYELRIYNRYILENIYARILVRSRDVGCDLRPYFYISGDVFSGCQSYVHICWSARFSRKGQGWGNHPTDKNHQITYSFDNLLECLVLWYQAAILVYVLISGFL